MASSAVNSMTGRYWWQLVGAVTVGVLAAAAVLAVVTRIYHTLILFGVGLLVAHLFDPILDRLQERGWSRLRAVWLLTLCAVLVLGIVVTAVVPPLVRQVQSAADAFPVYVSRMDALYSQARDWIVARIQNPDVAQDYAATLDREMADFRSWLTARFPAALRWLSAQLMRSLGWLVLLALLMVISFHFLMVVDDFRAGVRNLLPERAAPHLRALSSQMTALLGQYFRGLVTTAIFVGLASAAALGLVSLFFGTRYWLLIGLAHGPLYMVPWLGGAVADVLALFFGYTTAAQYPAAAALVSLAVMVVINQLGDILIMPRIVGRRVGLHPLAVLFGILAGYQLFGLAGTLVATPMMVGVKIVLAHWLPVKGPSLAEKAPRAFLDIDLPAAVHQLGTALARLRERLEHAVRSHASTQPPDAVQTKDGPTDDSSEVA
ncbi:MAG: AI-2E family transporter [Armatimonadetes bacterium]|nr:AI-2E family transporter [Armatimonadota bacterium]